MEGFSSLKKARIIQGGLQASSTMTSWILPQLIFIRLNINPMLSILAFSP